MNAFTFTTTPGTLHESERTSVSRNLDPVTGRTAEMLRTTRMEIRRIGEDIAIRFGATEVNLQARREMRPRRLL